MQVDQPWQPNPEDLDEGYVPVPDLLKLFLKTLLSEGEEASDRVQHLVTCSGHYIWCYNWIHINVQADPPSMSCKNTYREC